LELPELNEATPNSLAADAEAVVSTGGWNMQKPDRVNFDKLLGFKLLARELLHEFDFQDETLGARLGAKVGTEDMVALDVAYDAALKAVE
jgi:hypothetical protein